MPDYQRISHYNAASTLLYVCGCNQEFYNTKMLSYYTDKQKFVCQIIILLKEDRDRFLATLPSYLYLFTWLCDNTEKRKLFLIEWYQRKLCFTYVTKIILQNDVFFSVSKILQISNKTTRRQCLPELGVSIQLVIKK